MEKEKAIGLIQGRIEDEYRKHSANIGNWAEIAARKLYSQWDEFLKKADASKPTVDKEELTDYNDITKQRLSEFIDKDNKECEHNKGTFYSPETGTICQACKQKLVQIQVTEKQAKQFKAPY